MPAIIEPHLCGAGLAGHRHRVGGDHRHRRTVGNHQPHGVAHGRERRVADVGAMQQLTLRLDQDLAAFPVADLLDHVRAEDLAVVRHHGDHIGDLQRRDGDVSLADRQVDRIAADPAGTPLAQLPRRRRHRSRRLPRQIDAGRRTEAERHGVLGDVVDAQGESRLVEVDVAGLRERVVHVDVAVPLLYPVLEDPVAVGELAPARDRVARRPGAFLEQPGHHQNLEHARRRVGGADGAIDERERGVGRGGAECRGAAVADERLRIEPRVGDHGQDLAGGGPQHHHRAGARPERLLGRALQAPVDGQHDVGTGPRRHRGLPDIGDRALVHVHGTVADAVGAAQHRLVAFFDAALADRVAGRVALVEQHLQFLAGHVAHVAGHVRQRPDLAVVARRFAVPRHAGKRADLLCQRGDGGKVHVALQLDGTEQVPHVARHLLRQPALLHSQMAGEPLQQAGQLARRHLAGHHVHRKRRPVGDQHLAVGVVEDLAALRGNRDFTARDAAGAGAELDTAHHLQEEQVAADQQQRRPDAGGKADGAPPEQAPVLDITHDADGELAVRNRWI